MPSSRWTRRVAAMAAVAALGATGAQAAATEWPVSCTGGTFIVSSAGNSLTGICSQPADTFDSKQFDATDGINLVLNDVKDSLEVSFGDIGTLPSL